MKKIVKWIIVAVIVIAIILLVIVSMNKPLVVKTTTVTSGPAEMYFTEDGTVATTDDVSVFSVVSGQVESVNVVEGQDVKAGDVIATVDSSSYQYQIDQQQSLIDAYGAQASNLDAQTQKENDSLASQKDSLAAQLAATQAQDTQAQSTENSSNISKEDQIASQQSVIDKSQDDLDFAQDNLSKMQTLYDNGIVSKNDLDQAQQQVDSAQSAVTQANNQMTSIQNGTVTSQTDYYSAMEESLNAQISGLEKQMGTDYNSAMKNYYSAQEKSAQVSIDQLNDQIGKCTIVAPVSGKVETLSVSDSNVVSAATPVAVISPQTDLDIETYVTTTDIDEVQLGMPVDIVMDRIGGDQTYAGKVTKIDNEATDKVSPMGVSEKAVKVTVVPDDASVFSPGYDCKVKFVYYNEDNQLTVPSTAIFNDNGQDMVFVSEGGVCTEVPVEKGTELQTDTVITSGLNEGDIVVSDASTKDVKEGVKIESEK